MNLKSITKPIAALALLFVGSYGVIKAPYLHNEYIRRKVGSQVVKLTEKTGRSGGTGFALQMPSGEVLTMTNSHVCELERLGQIYASIGRKKFPMTILEKSINADLCLLNGLPNMNGLEVAGGVEIGDVISVVGHPALMPLAVNSGELLGYQEVVVMADDGPCEKEEGMYKTVEGFFGPVCTEQFEAGLTTVVVLGGNSGSPVVDWKGDVVGVLFAGHGPEGASWGVIVKLENLKEFIKNY